MKGATGSWLSRLFGRREAPPADAERVRLDAWMREGFEHQQKGSLSAAGRLYRQILDADPGYADAAYFLGTIADGEGRSEEAVSLYRDAVKAKPEEPTFLFALGNQYYRARRFEEAVQTLGRGLKLRHGVLPSARGRRCPIPPPRPQSASNASPAGSGASSPSMT